MPAPAFLIGGGRDDAAVLASHRPFTAALAGDGPVACLVLDEGAETDVARWEGNLRAAGADEVRVVVVSAGRPPVAADLDGAAGVYVAGGLTPGYQEALTADRSWLLAAAGLPYRSRCGSSPPRGERQRRIEFVCPLSRTRAGA